VLWVSVVDVHSGCVHSYNGVCGMRCVRCVIYVCVSVCVHSFLCVWVGYVVWEEGGSIQIIHLTKGVNFIHM